MTHAAVVDCETDIYFMSLWEVIMSSERCHLVIINCEYENVLKPNIRRIHSRLKISRFPASRNIHLLVIYITETRS